MLAFLLSILLCITSSAQCMKRVADEPVNQTQNKKQVLPITFIGSHETLTHALRSGNLFLVTSLLKEGVKYDTAIRFGELSNTLLAESIYNTNAEILTMLLNAGAKAHINNPNDMGWTPLMHAAKHGDIQILEKLIENGADITHGPKQLLIRSYAGPTVFGAATHNQNALVILDKLYTLLLSKKLSSALYMEALEDVIVYAVVNMNHTAYVWALSKWTELKTRIKSKKGINYIEKLERRSLTLRVRHNRMNQSQHVLSTNMFTILEYYKQPEVQEYLANPSLALEKCKNKATHNPTYNNQTLIMWASLFGHADILKKLLEHLVPYALLIRLALQTTNPVVPIGRSQLLAIISKNPTLSQCPVFKYINMPGPQGMTALMWATVFGYTDIVSILLPYVSSSINIANDCGATALSYALETHNSTNIDMLLRHPSTRIRIEDVYTAQKEDLIKYTIQMLGHLKEQPVF